MTRSTSVHPDKDRQALELRKAGAGYEQIARTMGYANKGGAHKAVMRALRESIERRNELAADVRELELQRLDEMMLGLWPEARKGKWLAIDRVLRIMERRACYLGLDAPKKQEITGADGGPIEIDNRVILTEEQRAERILAIVERARERSDFIALPAGPDLASTNGTTNGRVA